MGKNAHLLTTIRKTVEMRQNERQERGGGKWGYWSGEGRGDGGEGPGERASQERRRTPLL